ncbi:hypothetical protein LINPERHAP2_LOCUS19405 [Linum perenne]
MRRLLKEWAFLPPSALTQLASLGGIWLLWDPLIVTLDILEFGSQFIHAKGSLHDGSSFFLCVVYASPRATSRVLLWDALKRLSTNQCDSWAIISDFNSNSWAVISDFNSILSTKDKVGGSPFERWRNKSFIDTVDLFRLSDLPLSGPRFTWSRNNILSRIDRALVNSAWVSLLPESSVIHLHKLKSDHRPIVLCSSLQVYSSKVKPFRFMSAFPFVF